MERAVPGDVDEGGGSLRTRPGQKNYADRAWEKILLIVPGFFRKKFGANVTGPEIFCSNRFGRIF